MAMKLATVLLWFLVYAMPAGIAWAFACTSISRDRTKGPSLVVIHIAGALSLLASQYAIYTTGLSFPWRIDVVELLAIAVAVGLPFYFLKIKGVGYTFSAFAQEATMLSVAILLLPTFPVYVVILLVSLPFVLSHIVSLNHPWWQIALLALWGILIIPLFLATESFYIVGGIHAAVGSFLISRSENGFLT